MKISINLGLMVGKIQNSDALRELFGQCMEAIQKLDSITGNIEVIILSPISGPGMPNFEGRLVMSFFRDAKYEETFLVDLENGGAKKAIINTAELILSRYANDCKCRLLRAKELVESIPS